MTRVPGAEPGDPARPAGRPTAHRAVQRQAWSVGLATGAYGVSFGALSVASGLDVWQTVALSALMFTGGSQFAFVGVIGAGGTGLAAIATSTLLGIRNGLYGLQVSEFLGVRRAQRALAAQLTIDESTAVAIAQDHDHPRRIGFWHTGISSPSSGLSSVTPSATRGAGDWTEQRPLPSWRCCGRGCARETPAPRRR